MVPPISAAVTCHACGKDVLYVGKLPAIGFHAAMHVFKCETCMTVHTTPARLPESGVSGRSDGLAISR